MHSIRPGTHFTAEITNHLLAKTLAYFLKFHTPYHPQSLGQLGCKNLDIKRTVGKISQETGFKWPEALSSAFIKTQNTANKRHELTHFEIVFRHPMPTGIFKLMG